jgi:hypothetical protein
MKSPHPPDRIAGFFYFLVFFVGGITVAVSGRIVVPGNAAATAANIIAHEPRFWLGLTFNLLVIACYIAVTALFYELFQPVNRLLSLLAAFFSLMGCAVQAFSFAFYAAIAVLRDATYVGSFTMEQLQSIALIFFKLYFQAYNLGLPFFGFYCLLIGYLVFRSTYLPRFVGLLMMLGGMGWLTFLYPPLANALRPYNLLPGIVGEGSLTLWLLAMGVNNQRWKEKVAAVCGSDK